MNEEDTNPTQHRASIWQFILGALLLPLTVPLLAAMVLLSIPYGIAATIYLHLRDRRAIERMRVQARFRDWNHLQADLNAGRGTLIVAMAQKEGASVWWTPDDVVSTSPVPVTPPNRLNYFDMLEPHGDTFVQWCHESYIDEESGRGMIVNEPRSVWKGCRGFDHNFRKLYPRMNVVETVRIVGRRKSL